MQTILTMKKRLCKNYLEILKQNLDPQITVIILCWFYDKKKDEKQVFVRL